jgi:hypothetical protein
MTSDVRIKGRVVIREILKERITRATLPNGKEIIAYVHQQDPLPELRVGDEWTVELSLCNFSRGRLAQAAPPPLPAAGASSDS